jgi:hypothetical protein
MAEPVLQDSLTYWEKQSATYNGVLGVSVILLVVSRRCLTLLAGGYGSGVHPIFSFILALLDVPRLVTSPR